ncbi:MAG: YcaO-like family protein [Desulfobacterales bacterium]
MNCKIILKDAFKKFTLDQDKILSPEETVRRFKSKLKTIDLDILEDTLRIDKGRLNIPVYFSTCGKDAAAMIGTKKQMGKGATPQQAEASAVMELAERFSFFSYLKNPENFFVEKYRNLKKNAISFEMIAQSVHDDSKDLNNAQKVFENLSLKWTKAYNLTRNQEMLIPFNWFYTINEFNGPSAGNCAEEALSQGICEIVERHVSSLISRNRMKVPAIIASSITDPMSREMLQKYKKAGIRLYISDFSLDMGIPSIGVLAYDPTTFPKRSEIVWTAGTTPDPEKALSRALTEVAQLSGDFDTGSKYVASGLPKFSRIEDAEFIINPTEKIDIKALPDLSNKNIKIEVQNCIAALARKNMEVIVVNTRHPLLDVPAFYTIVPGAHFRERSLGTSVGMFSAKIIAETEPPRRAVEELKNIEMLLTDKYYIKFYLGACHLALDDPETALGYFTRSLELDPTEQDISSIYSYMGISLNKMGEYRKALDVLEHAEAHDSERTDIYNSMGFSYFKLKEHEKAITCFKKVLQIDPGSAIDYANIASNYREMGQKEKAVEYYKTALAMDPSIDFARENLVKLTIEG